MRINWTLTNKLILELHLLDNVTSNWSMSNAKLLSSIVKYQIVSISIKL